MKGGAATVKYRAQLLLVGVVILLVGEKGAGPGKGDVILALAEGSNHEAEAIAARVGETDAALIVAQGYYSQSVTEGQLDRIKGGHCLI